MKKNLLSLVLALVMMTTMLAAFAVNASAIDLSDPDNYEPAHATAVDSQTLSTQTYSYIKDGSPTDVNLADWIRQNAGAEQLAREPATNALGAPDATQTGGDNKFTGLRYYDEATYSFHGATKRLIANYPGDDPDLSLIEVTWGTGWHVEAVDVYLVGAVTRNGDGLLSPPSTEPVKIGTAFNKVGIEKGYDGGLECTYTASGNFGYTNIFFPDNIAYAEAVQLKDVTSSYNEPTPTSKTYKSYDEGFDLDALKAWYTIEAGNLNAVFTLQKMISHNNVEWDGAGFEFELHVFNGTNWVYHSTAWSDEFGSVYFNDLDTGSYMVKEVASNGYTLTNYTEGYYFDVVGDSIIYKSSDESEGAPTFVNAYTSNWASDTSWAGRVTDNKKFPMHNKSKFAEFDGAKRSGQSNWAMAVIYTGGEAVVDIVMGQNSDIGDITVRYLGDKFVVSGVVTEADCKVTHVHADASSSIDRFTNAKGNGNFAVNRPVQMEADGSFSFEIPYSYTGGTAYVGIHMESARDLNYDLLASQLP